MMDDIVTQYLPQAFAFIYVINSANAGGVQKDRVSSKYNQSLYLLQSVQRFTQHSTCYSKSHVSFNIHVF